MRRVVLIGVALLASACGAARAEAPPASGEPGDRVDALERDLRAAEARLRTGVAREGALGAATTPSAPAPPPPAPVTEAAPEADEPASSPPPSEASAASGCDLACRAFASMKRAADGICELAGDSDARCVRARGRVSDASELLRKSGCTCP